MPTASTNRRILAGLFWFLASLAIMVAAVTVWAHRTVLTEAGWGSIVATVAADPAVIDNTSTVLVDRVFEALDIDSRVASVLPGSLDIVAGALTRGVEERIAAGVAGVAATPEFQEAFVRINERAYQAAMTVIRGGDAEALTTDDGAITLNVFPLVESVLVSLQDAGLIDASRQIPDLSDYEPNPDRVAQLESLLGRELPDDLGTITLVQSDRLARVQEVVRAFDIITIVLVLVAIACVLIALWLSARRLRMVVWLALGAIGALAIGRLFTRLIVEEVTGSLRTDEAGLTVRSVVESSVDSIMWFTFVLIIIALLVAGVAMWWERRDAAPAEDAAVPRSVGEWLRDHRNVILYGGIAVIAFFVLWRAAGPDTALLAAAAIGLLVVAVNLLTPHEPGPEPTPTPTGDSG